MTETTLEWTAGGQASTHYPDLARKYVVEYFNDRVEKTTDFKLEFDQTFVVMFSYILGGWKALVSTTIPDGMYYELTYNVTKGETYLDAYKKFENVCYYEVPSS